MIRYCVLISVAIAALCSGNITGKEIPRIPEGAEETLSGDELKFAKAMLSFSRRVAAISKERMETTKNKQSVILMRKRITELQKDPWQDPILDIRTMNKGAIGIPAFTTVTHTEHGIELHPELRWFQYRVQQVIDESNLLIEFDKETFWLSGIDTSEMVDGKNYSFDMIFEFVGTRSYTSVVSAKRTIRELKQFSIQSSSDVSKKVELIINESNRTQEAEKNTQQLFAKKTSYRRWTSSSGKHNVTAKYNGSDDSHVFLLKKDGSELKVPITKLSESDRDMLAKFESLR